MFISILLGGVHQPEPKCHLDLKSNFIILRGGTSASTKIYLDLKSNFIILGGTSDVCCNLLQLLQCWGVHWMFAVTCFNFYNAGGGVHQPEPKSNFVIWGGGYISQNQNVTLTCFNFYNAGVGGGVHQPEPKCYIDLRFQLFHYLWGGGYIRSCSILLQLFQSWGGVHLPAGRLVNFDSFSEIGYRSP